MANGTRNCSHFKLRTWVEGDREGREKGGRKGRREGGREGRREGRERRRKGGRGREEGKGEVLQLVQIRENHPKVCWRDKYLNSPLWLE